MMKMKKPELLSPAGDWEKLQMAVLYGADAVYLAGTSFGMRSFAGNFDDEALPKAVRFAHDHGVKVHATVNTMPRWNEAEALPAHLEKLDAAGVDALILADLGAFTPAGKYAPHCQRHISTQQSIANHVCAQAWYDLGASRVVLARELSLEEIAAIRARVSPELELEAFCHGAMCVSYSGRCLLSNYMTGRDSNRGECAQPCRYQYALMEEKRPGEYFPVFEDEKGTYIMNSRDMCMIDHLDDLMAAGVDCLKIEGRAKSAYYAAIVTGAYRHCLDDVAAGRPLDPVWRDEVEHISHRHYATGFFYGQPGQYYESARYLRDWQICAVVTNCDENGLGTLSLRNKFAAGDIVEVVTSQSAHGPSRDWVKIARSSNARSKIRQWLKRERRDENVVTGRASFESELKRCGVSLKELTNDENLPGILKKLTYKSLDDLYAAIGYGGISSLKVIGRIREDIQRILHQHQEERQAEVPLEGRPDATRPAVPKRTHSEKGIIVEGLSNCLVKFSKCCTPVPGDDIVGFITKGYGVSVHRRDCPNADPARRRPDEEGRWIKVSWAEDVEGTFRTTLQVVAKDRINLIVDISTVLSSTKTHVASMNARSTPDGFALITLDTDVSSSQQLKTVMRRIEQISGVMRVTRPAG